VIHTQRLRNNGFQGSDPGLEAYEPVGDVELSVDTENPLSDAIPNSLGVSVQGDEGEVGFSNYGYWGIQLGWGNFTTGFYMKGDYQGPVSIQVVGNVENTIHANVSLYVDSSASEFRYFETTIPTHSINSGTNRWQLTFDASRAAGETFYFDLIQLWQSPLE
jgi:alpha-N-arabinofuranosidase